MTCRHAKDDPACSSHPDNVERDRYLRDQEAERARKAMTPDAAEYEIVEVARVGPHLVLKVLYPNCKLCSYEGNKILVFLDISEVDVLRWRKIDPHFRAPTPRVLREAPSPAARFPASKDGWDDALAYAQRKRGTDAPVAR